METYYWENPVGFSPDQGEFQAENDEEALQKVPKTAIFLYRERDSKDGGKPFHVVKLPRKTS
jgi:hypothetical protein